MFKLKTTKAGGQHGQKVLLGQFWGPPARKSARNFCQTQKVLYVTAKLAKMSIFVTFTFLALEQSFFEIWRWPGYQKCSKVFKVFEFFCFKSKFCFYKRLWLKTPIGLKKKLPKKANFHDFHRFWQWNSDMFSLSNWFVFAFFRFSKARRTFFILSWCF